VSALTATWCAGAASYPAALNLPLAPGNQYEHPLGTAVELAMTVDRTFHRGLTAIAMLAVFSLGGTLTAAAETDVYKDVRMLNGHARSMAAKRADMRACGAINGMVSNADFPRSNECMQAHGWAIDHVVPEPSHDNDHGTVVHFDDLKKKPSGDWRGDAALQADTRRCSPRRTIDYDSSEFKQCMLGHGWQFAYTKHAPTPPARHAKAGQEKTWQEIDDDGALVACRGILGGFGKVCSNF
jgi:hypothetical protein